MKVKNKPHVNEMITYSQTRKFQDITLEKAYQSQKRVEKYHKKFLNVIPNNVN